MSFIAPTWEDAHQVRWHFRQGNIDAMMVMHIAFEWVSGSDTAQSMVRALHFGIHEFVLQYVMHGSAFLTKTDRRLSFGAELEHIYEEELSTDIGFDPMPPHDCLYVRQTHPYLNLRAGQKRVPFLGEGINDGGQLSLTNTARNNIEAFFGGISQIHDYDVYPYEEGEADILSTWNIRPLVIGRKQVLSPTPVYVLDDDRVAPVTDAICVNVSTMNSRKK